MQVVKSQINKTGSGSLTRTIELSTNTEQHGKLMNQLALPLINNPLSIEDYTEHGDEGSISYHHPSQSINTQQG